MAGSHAEAPRLVEQGGAHMDSLGGWSGSHSTPLSVQVQILIEQRAVRPSIAGTLASAIFGGAHG
jgi:hypothetical protein